MLTNVIFFLLGVLSVTFNVESELLTVKGKGIDEDKIKRKLKKMFSHKKGWLGCFSSK